MVLKSRGIMATYEHLEKAPITEALIDIRVKLANNFQIENLDSIGTHIADKYPTRKIRKRFETQIQFKQGEKPSPEGIERIDGYLFSSNDKKQIVQARFDGFTFSRLKPYQTWKDLRDEARQLWQIYLKISSPELITRVAVRYINNLNIPLPIKDFSDYLTAPPIVPEKLPQGISSFLTRTVIHEGSLGAQAIITQALEQMVRPGFAPVILDIDVFKEVPDGIEGDVAWETLEKLRHFKNDIFFESITEKLKGLYL